MKSNIRQKFVARKWRAFAGCGLLMLMLAQALVYPSPAAACMCGNHYDTPGHFMGKVVRIDHYGNQKPDPRWSHLADYRYLFEVQHAWSGIDTSYITLVSGGDCGMRFDEGVTYEINMNISSRYGAWSTGHCMGSGRVTLPGEESDRSSHWQYAELISQYGEGVPLRQITIEQAIAATDSAGGNITLLTLALWVIVLSAIVITMGVAFKDYQCNSKAQKYGG